MKSLEMLQMFMSPGVFVQPRTAEESYGLADLLFSAQRTVERTILPDYVTSHMPAPGANRLSEL